MAIPAGRGRRNRIIGRVLRYALVTSALATAAFFWRQRRHPIPHPPPLTFLFENPITEKFVGVETLLDRLDPTPGMRVLDAGCGPGRLTIPLAKVVGPRGRVVALDSQSSMLRKLERRLGDEGLTNVRSVKAGLGEGTLKKAAIDRALLTMALGEVRGKEAALRELYGALVPGGILSVTEAFGDPDYRRPRTVRREVEAAGFKLVARFGGFPAYTLNFEKPWY